MSELGPEHFRAIADFTYDWETWVGPSGEVSWVNPAVERITGYSVEECLAMRGYPLPLVYEPDRRAVSELLARASAGQSGNHHEFRVLRKDGAIVWAAISFQPVAGRKGNRLGYRSSVRDIHERKQLEQRLSEALVAAEAASQAKSEFLANVSHELRTPLQSILGYAELLAASGLEPPRASYAATLLEQSQVLDRLVGDLLDYSSLSAGLLPLRAETYEPAEAIARVVRACEPLAARKGLRLELDASQGQLRCVGDPLRVSQIITNLIGNGIKFTDHGQVRVSLGAADVEGRYRIVVDDTGPGMPDDETLFAPFRRGSGESARKAGGVGLGLAISRQLCERMGGSLESRPSPLGGARFVAELPVVLPESGRGPSERGQPNPETPVPNPTWAVRDPLNVLVVDDVAPAREFLSAALSALGHEARLAATAEQAFACAETAPCDLALVDIQMPEIDGWSTARGLRTRLGPGPLLIALSADARAGEAPRLKAAGFDDFAQKPLRLEQLELLLSRARARVRAKSPPAPGTFDPLRWRELAGITIDGGSNLLERMRVQVSRALPDTWARARGAAPGPELARTLHELHGLLALIGATRACKYLEQGEPRAQSGTFGEPDWAELEAELRSVAAGLTANTRND